MGQARYRKDTSDSFFGEFLYEQVVPKDHFLYRLRHEIPWGTITAPIMKVYKGGAEYGPTPYHPEKLLRMLLVAYLFGISERRSEEMINDSLSAKYFVGLGVDEKAPDHSTLTYFKARITEKKGVGIWEKMFEKTIRIAKRQGITFGTLQLVDSTHTTANVNEEEDKKRKKKGKPPRDPQATHKTKGEKTVLTKDNKRIKVKDRIYGYKAHTSMNQESKLITSVKATTAKRDDGKEFVPLVNKDKRLGIVKDEHPTKEENTAYSADKGYDQGDNQYHLESHNLFSAIILKKIRKQEKWQQMKQSPHYQALIKLRPQVEAKFGEEKQWHRFDRCRYLGLSNYKIQAYMTAMAVNFKRIIKLTKPVTGLALPPPMLAVCPSISS